eukprot:gnl/TRDRNA2_/TRDRNA2_137145_c0_seq1.p4 gnl/TRDRNA2_/TRDRNA2_137145_c0~~gnl/TRDRNA2_/TRDRNA2_137145_c0_seq1.p4  ORF type:complete len:101 (-),score=3.16 gnl/TRDRNA2_/TRDRNA2_137145_c0_seq1:81-383(-)
MRRQIRLRLCTCRMRPAEEEAGFSLVGVHQGLEDLRDLQDLHRCVCPMRCSSDEQRRMDMLRLRRQYINDLPGDSLVSFFNLCVLLIFSPVDSPLSVSQD